MSRLTLNVCSNEMGRYLVVKSNTIMLIEKYIDHSDLDVKYVNKFLGLLACEVWYRLFITKEIDSNDTLN